MKTANRLYFAEDPHGFHTHRILSFHGQPLGPRYSFGLFAAHRPKPTNSIPTHLAFVNDKLSLDKKPTATATDPQGNSASPCREWNVLRVDSHETPTVSWAFPSKSHAGSQLAGGSGISRSRQIFRAKKSLISVWRGREETYFWRGFTKMVCRPPSRMIWQPFCWRCLMSSRRFTAPPGTRAPCALPRRLGPAH